MQPTGDAFHNAVYTKYSGDLRKLPDLAALSGSATAIVDPPSMADLATLQSRLAEAPIRLLFRVISPLVGDERPRSQLCQAGLRAKKLSECGIARC
jgi:hypothetical protein